MGKTNFRRPLLATALLLAVAPGRLVIAQSASAAAPERIDINDNRKPAGDFAAGVLTIRLEARRGRWHPDGPARPGIVVNAFAVEGSPLEVPGPLVRVPQGTRVHAFVRNRLEDQPLAVHGLYARPTASEAAAPIVVPPGDVRELTFVAADPGTYFYWAAAKADTPLNLRAGADSQLTGAFVVDPQGMETPRDRVLVIGGWNNVNGPFTAAPGERLRWVVNGLSWPNTERLTYQVDEVVRIRVINTSFGVHPMHLHGFYFDVESRGDERQDTVFPPGASPHLVVTERLPIGYTFSLKWIPTRAGNWLFHCHDSAHLDYGGQLDHLEGPPNDRRHHVESSELDMMSGPVIGISIAGTPAATSAEPVTRRHLRLVARAEAGGTDAEPAFAYALEGDGVSSNALPSLPGPILLLKQGEPVDVTVVNELPEPTAVHWHGIELDSYFDGVPGFAGDMARTAPSIEPGGTFDALFTPPRSGTFIYHAHMDDRRQQQAGLSGPLVIVESPESYDPVHDVVLMVTAPRRAADGTNGVLVNGSLKPVAREFHIAQHYRIRLINLHTARPNMRMRFLAGNALMTWTGIAKDGMDLPRDQSKEGPAEIQMGNGETYDFDFVPTTPGDARFEVRTGSGTGATIGDGILLASMTLHITP